MGEKSDAVDREGEGFELTIQIRRFHTRSCLAACNTAAITTLRSLSITS